MPARDNDDDDDLYARELDRHGGIINANTMGMSKLPAGVVPTSHATLTEAFTESGTNRSPSASHIDAGGSSDMFGRDNYPDEEWPNTRDLTQKMSLFPCAINARQGHVEQNRDTRSHFLWTNIMYRWRWDTTELFVLFL